MGMTTPQMRRVPECGEDKLNSIKRRDLPCLKQRYVKELTLGCWPCLLMGKTTTNFLRPRVRAVRTGEQPPPSPDSEKRPYASPPRGPRPRAAAWPAPRAASALLPTVRTAPAGTARRSSSASSSSPSTAAIRAASRTSSSVRCATRAALVVKRLSVAHAGWCIAHKC